MKYWSRTFRAFQLLFLIILPDLILKFIMILVIPKEFPGAALMRGYMTQEGLTASDGF